MDNHDGVKKNNGRKETNLKDYWTLILRRKWVVIAFALPLFAVATTYSFVKRPSYAAKGTLLIEKEPNILTFEEIFQIDSFNLDYQQTQYKLLESRSLVENTIEKLSIDEIERSLGSSKVKKESPDDTDSILRSKLIDWFLKKLEVKPVIETRLVEVTFRDQDPKFAAQAVNTLFDSFIEMNINLKYEATEQARAFLTDQIASLRSEIERKEQEHQKYGAEKNIIALSDKETIIVEKLGELNRALTEAQIDRVRKEAYYNEIKTSSPDHISEALSNPLIQRLREDYLKLKREYIKMQETFLPEYPEMGRLKAELEGAQKSLLAETQALTEGAYADYQAALNKERSLRNVFDTQKEEAIQLNSNAILYNSLQIEIENQKNLMESLLRRQSETGVSAQLKGLKPSNVRVVDRAEIPLNPSSPKKKLNMILALFLGLFGGTGLAFVFDYLDNSVRNLDDVEERTGLPLLGFIPKFCGDGLRNLYAYKNREQEESPLAEILGINPGEDRIKKNKIKSIELIAHFSPESNFSEHYRSIRTTLLHPSTDRDLRSIVFSSSVANEGKTTTLCNLAITFAQANKSVLIVDSDLRRSRLHEIFNVDNSIGLTNYLTAKLDKKDRENLIKETHIPNLYLLNAGPVAQKPVELLGSKKMATLIESVKQCFDYVFFDAPPSLAVSDVLVLGPKCDGVVLTVWGGKTSRELLSRTKEILELHKIETLGVIINNITIKNYGCYYMYQ